MSFVQNISTYRVWKGSWVVGRVGRSRPNIERLRPGQFC